MKKVRYACVRVHLKGEHAHVNIASFIQQKHCKYFKIHSILRDIFESNYIVSIFTWIFVLILFLHLLLGAFTSQICLTLLKIFQITPLAILKSLVALQGYEDQGTQTFLVILLLMQDLRLSSTPTGQIFTFAKFPNALYVPLNLRSVPLQSCFLKITHYQNLPFPFPLLCS